MRRGLLLVALLLGACGGGGAENGAPAPPPPVATPGLAKTACGDYQGVDGGDAWSFLGIRYAAAPAGALRWRSPEPPQCPAATVAADRYAEVCPQLARDSGLPKGDEDCLALNVFAPKAVFPAGGAPVMVFIHGGGNVSGSARQEVEPGRVLYDGAGLAAATGNVVVTVQYRLGPLGWLVHPGLDAEAADARSGNYGLEDLIAALGWVRREAAAFGGDSNRVMIFGESAGGVNVCALMASPAAAGLFQAAAIQSGGCVADTRLAALAVGQELADGAGCSTAADVVACLRARSPAELLAALPPQVSVAGTRPVYQPSVDGLLLPDAPLAVVAAGQHARVPLVIGANADETGQEVPLAFSEAQYQAILVATFPNATLRAAVESLYSAAAFGSARRAYIALTSDLRFICPSRTMARAFAAVPPAPVYRYFFTEVPDAPAATAFGAFHGLELLYLFGILDLRSYAPTAAERALATTMQELWGELAAAGTPTAAGAPGWAAYDAGRDNHLVLDADAVAMAEGVNTARCDFWESLLSR
jgi:para-nitrobenzyl esterase